MDESDNQVKSPRRSDAQPTAQKPPIKDRLQMAQNVLALVGGLGTLFVWGAANFFVGDVEVVPNRPYQNLTVEIYDHKGEQSTFHVPKFQLMPGMYHVDISADGSRKYPADIEVKFGQKRRVLVSLDTPAANGSKQTASDSEKLQLGAHLPGSQRDSGKSSTNAAPQQVSSENDADESQPNDRDLHRHWWQFHHKKVD